MFRSNRFILSTLLSLLFIGFFSVPSRATTAVLLSDREMIVSSRFIVKGSVRSVTTAWDDMQNIAWTYVEVELDNVLKGELAAPTVILKQLGGDPGNGGVYVFGQPTFIQGQRVLLYLNTAADGTLHVAHSFMGRYAIETNSQTGEEIISRPLPRAEIELLSRPDHAVVTDTAALADHVRKIYETLNTDADVALYAARYNGEPLTITPAEYYRKRLDASLITPSFALTANGVRWMEADSGQAVRFFLNPANSPVSGGGTAEMTRAMSAWASQSGASIGLQIAGQTTSCGQQNDGVNVISFGDCLGQLDLPVGCSGVVAQTLVRYTGETRVIGGTTFRRLIESDIVFNRGMTCFLGTSATLAEVACHELGHAIGLGHSEDGNAIMWSVARGGRDATLGNDDIAGVLAIYPSASGGGGGTPTVDDSAFLTQSVSTNMNPGQSYAVSVTLRNTGTTTWRDSVKLASQNPSDSSTWGTSRVSLPTTVSPGSDVTFQFNVTAPSASGVYNFQWRLLKDGGNYFGAFTPNVTVQVGETGGGGGNLVITTVSFVDAVIGRAYKQSVNATGGSQPYRWFLIGGALPTGLNLLKSGSIEGTPTKTGTYNFTLQIYDNGTTTTSDTRRLTIKVVEPGSSGGNPSTAPIITSIKLKKSKKLSVYGQNFSSNSLILFNGVVLTPKSFEQDGALGLLFYKGNLEVRPTGTNTVQVINQGNNSGVFLF